MSKWVLAALLVLGAHFSASYVVPLDAQAQKTFGGLLRWAWPWAYGDGGLLGRISQPSGFPIAGFFIAATSGSFFFLAALAVMGWWIPFGWWRLLAAGGAVLQLVLMVSFLGPTKLTSHCFRPAVAVSAVEP